MNKCVNVLSIFLSEEYTLYMYICVLCIDRNNIVLYQLNIFDFADVECTIVIKEMHISMAWECKCNNVLKCENAGNIIACKCMYICVGAQRSFEGNFFKHRLISKV